MNYLRGRKKRARSFIDRKPVPLYLFVASRFQRPHTSWLSQQNEGSRCGLIVEEIQQIDLPRSPVTKYGGKQ